MKCQKINTRPGILEFSSWGKGFPILILHGAHSNCEERLFHYGFDLNKYRLITPSRPGYGGTHLSSKTTPRDDARQIIELIQFLGIDKFMVFGASTGGLTAISLASHYPKMVTRLVLASAVSKRWLFPADIKYKIARLLFHPDYEFLSWGFLRFCGKIAPGILAIIFQKQFSTKSITNLNEKETYILIHALKKYRSQNGFYNDLEQDLDPEVLRNIICPTLIVHSENDKSVSIDHAFHANYLIPGSRMERLENDWGHLIWIGKDSYTAIQKILSFMEEEI